MNGPAERAWNAEYRAGRYATEAPVAFLGDLIAAARTAGAGHGLEIGCGNGRHLLPLLEAGVDMTGLDISAEAIAQLRVRRPDRADRFVHGDLTVLPPEQRWPLVCLWGILRRRLRYRGGRHPDGVHDRINLAFLRWVLGFRRRHAPAVRACITEHGAHAVLIEVTSRHQANGLVTRLGGPDPKAQRAHA